jgi:hypothetical protein
MEGRHVSDERNEALVLADKLLDQPWADPDDDLRTLARQLLRREQRILQLEEAFCMNTPWPLLDVLEKLVAAATHLLDDHGCDAQGHESYRYAREAAIGRVIPAIHVALGFGK